MSYDDNYRPSRAKRSIVKSSTHHFVGQLVFTAADGVPQALGFGSLLEHDVALCCLYDPQRHDLEEQLDPVAFRHPDGRLGTHWLDFRWTLQHGKRIAIAVKPYQIANRYTFQETMKAVSEAAIPEIADAVYIVTERHINPIKLHNAKLFHAARYPDAGVDDQIAHSLEHLTDPMTIRDFSAGNGLHGNGFFGIARAVHRGLIHADLNERLSPNSVIRRAEGPCRPGISNAEPRFSPRKNAAVDREMAGKTQRPISPMLRPDHVSPPRTNKETPWIAATTGDATQTHNLME